MAKLERHQSKMARPPLKPWHLTALAARTAIVTMVLIVQ